MLDSASDEEDSDLVQSCIFKSKDAAKRIERIISFTKDYQDFGSGFLIWLSVREMIQSVLVDLPPRIEGVNHIPENLELFIDPLLKKVFSTLIDNAIRHGGTITQITFSIQEERNHLTIIIEDDGIGIPPDQKERIFERGYGLNTGLGLYLSREICAITGIEIVENGDIGARFEMIIPKGSYRWNE
jgi:signal transduction histidine kinase